MACGVRQCTASHRDALQNLWAACVRRRGSEVLRHSRLGARRRSSTACSTLATASLDPRWTVRYAASMIKENQFAAPAKTIPYRHRLHGGEKIENESTRMGRLLSRGGQLGNVGRRRVAAIGKRFSNDNLREWARTIPRQNRGLGRKTEASAARRDPLGHVYRQPFHDAQARVRVPQTGAVPLASAVFRPPHR